MVCCVTGYFELCDMLVSDDNVGFVIFKGLGMIVENGVLF